MKNKFKADPMNILGIVLVILLLFVVLVTAFLLIGYNKLFSSSTEGVTSDVGGPSAPIISDADTSESVTPNTTPLDSSVQSSAETDRVTDAPTESTDTAQQTTAPNTAAPTESTAQPSTGKKTVAITFDDGPHPTYTLELLEILEKYNVKATFFVLGTNLKSDARINVLKKTVAAGHEIGNHSYSHPTVLEITADEFLLDAEKGSDAIYSACGVRPALIRTPGGKFSTELLGKIQSPIIHWTVDTRDWEHNDPDTCLEKLKAQVYDGAIILMHDRKSNVAKSAEVMIKWLLDNDYNITTVSELMEIKGVEMQAGKVYYSSSIIKPKD